MNPIRVLLVVGTVGCALSPVQAATRPTDPWPSSAVLTRLFALPAGRADGQRLIRELHLTAAQSTELRRLARSEAAYAQAGRQLFGRDEAAALNAKLSRMSAEKDRKVRLSLAGKYGSFRGWVRTWWRAEVTAAR
ncbi:hypothetical protein ACFFLM_11450 [Deinococcus oregonensis]|uniref:Uncharacterized protein n=1 Tax=Deinococcus oregonensis TaxID=1805970 RepID=A0ABV6AYJ9_9DEIO